jgi:hypothetical protein
MHSDSTARWMAVAGLGLAALVAHPGAATCAPAAVTVSALPPSDVSAQQRRRPPRITVVPLSRYHRECVAWFAVDHRPSGDVVMPRQRCTWALR